MKLKILVLALSAASITRGMEVPEHGFHNPYGNGAFPLQGDGQQPQRHYAYPELQPGYGQQPAAPGSNGYQQMPQVGPHANYSSAPGQPQPVAPAPPGTLQDWPQAYDPPASPNYNPNTSVAPSAPLVKDCLNKPDYTTPEVTRLFLPVELGAGYCMGLIMSDEIAGLLKKLGVKNVVTVNGEKLKKKRAWYVPALILISALAYKFSEPSKTFPPVCECLFEPRQRHKTLDPHYDGSITRIPLWARIGNAAAGFCLGLLVPHWSNAAEKPKSGV